MIWYEAKIIGTIILIVLGITALIGLVVSPFAGH
jgi:hypothetical protein